MEDRQLRQHLGKHATAATRRTNATTSTPTPPSTAGNLYTQRLHCGSKN